MRSLVASSWRRAAAAGVDPDGRPPRIVDEEEAHRVFSRNPVRKVLPRVEKLLAEATTSAGGFAAFSDAGGLLLWVDGTPEALEVATGAGFAPGHLVSEAALGTNAVGTAIEIDHAVQIFSAEHYNRGLHGLTCVAAPIRDPESGELLGVLDLSANFRTGHPHSLTLVTAIAATIEASLATEASRRDDRRCSIYVERVVKVGCERSALIAESGRVIASSPQGWLGTRVRLTSDGRPSLPAGVTTVGERIEGASVVAVAKGGRGTAPETIQIEPADSRRLKVTIGSWSTELSRRHSEILAVLALNPRGLSGEELSARLPAPAPKLVTLRSEIHRLRAALGPVVAGSPYRIVGGLELDSGALDCWLRNRAPFVAATCD
jgi:hypothetical protein